MFLDIRMPVKNGIEVAHALGGRCHTVFVTAYDEYAVAAFEEGAVDYVLKPVTAERMAKVVARLKSRLAAAPLDIQAVLARLAEREAASPLKWIRASLGTAMKLIATDDVLYFQAEDKYTKVVTQDADALIKKPIKELYEELDPDAFWQIHRGTIVNLRAIARVERDWRDQPVILLKDRAGEAHRVAHVRAAVQEHVTRAAAARTGARALADSAASRPVEPAGRDAGGCPRHGKMVVLPGRPMTALAATIDAAWERRTEFSPQSAPADVADAVAQIIAELDAGRLRVAEKTAAGWVTHQWIKKAVLLSFRLADNRGIGLTGPEVAVPLLRQGADQVRADERRGVRRVGRARGAARRRAQGRVRREERRADAVVREHRRLRRRRHDGRHVGHRRLVRADRQERAPVGRRRHRRRAGTAAGQPHDHRGQLLHRRALGGGRRRDRRGELGARAWACSSARARRSTTGPRARSPTAACPADRSSWPAACPRATSGCHLYCAVIVKQVDAKTRAKTSINELLRA